MYVFIYACMYVYIYIYIYIIFVFLHAWPHFMPYCLAGEICFYHGIGSRESQPKTCLICGMRLCIHACLCVYVWVKERKYVSFVMEWQKTSEYMRLCMYEGMHIMSYML